MQVHLDLNQLPRFNQAVVTIGTFDGVHVGHQQIIQRVREHARETGGESVIITFEPHPRLIVHRNDPAVEILTTLEEKIICFEKLGIDHLVVVPFTEAFAHQTAEAYIRDFLVEKFHPHTIIIGYDHRFGNNREGDLAMLEQASGAMGFQLEEIPVQLIHSISVSSTKIREALKHGDVPLAAEMLGCPYFLLGRVVHGDKRGRQLGYHTANLELSHPHKLVPENGVYAVEVKYRGEFWNGMMNIGFRPTVDNNHVRSIEVHILDFNEDIYDQVIEVRFINRIRDEKKFSSIEELKKQLDLDKQATIQFLHKNL
jgi:riboflavin kinase/FMN adenylyltransferase